MAIHKVSISAINTHKHTPCNYHTHQQDMVTIFSYLILKIVITVIKLSAKQVIFLSRTKLRTLPNSQADIKFW